MDLKLSDITAYFEEQKKRMENQRIAYGYACSPAVHSQLKKLTPAVDPGSHQTLFPMPVIIDPRMTSGFAEVFYSREAFMFRLKEQNEFDRLATKPTPDGSPTELGNCQLA